MVGSRAAALSLSALGAWQNLSAVIRATTRVAKLTWIAIGEARNPMAIATKNRPLKSVRIATVVTGSAHDTEITMGDRRWNCPGNRDRSSTRRQIRVGSWRVVLFHRRVLLWKLRLAEETRNPSAAIPSGGGGTIVAVISTKTARRGRRQIQRPRINPVSKLRRSRFLSPEAIS